MSNNVIYTDGACSANGTSKATGGFGMYIHKNQFDSNKYKINKKGSTMKSWNNETLYITNIRMEGLAIVSTLALFHKLILEKEHPDFVNILNTTDPFLTEGMAFGANPKRYENVEPTQVEIITDSMFWIQVIQDWLPGWIRKNIADKKKNPDIVLMMHQYYELLTNNNVNVIFTFVRSHQKGKRTIHADENDIADILATTAVNNPNDSFMLQE